MLVWPFMRWKYSTSFCVVLTPDMDGDGRSERLLCALASDSAQCQLSARVAGEAQVITEPYEPNACEQCEGHQKKKKP